MCDGLGYEVGVCCGADRNQSLTEGFHLFLANRHNFYEGNALEQPIELIYNSCRIRDEIEV